MIRNIVFDMEMLIDYQPMKYTRRFSDPSEAVKFVRNSLAALATIGSRDIEPQAASARSANGCQPPVPVQKSFLPLVRSTDHHPRDQRARQQMKENGYRLYPLECRLQLYQYCSCIPIFPLLDGCIVSADEKL
ncbi:MAG: hypothetical protein ACLS8R_02865 [Anaeromassilibacillus sp.]